MFEVFYYGSLFRFLYCLRQVIPLFTALNYRYYENEFPCLSIYSRLALLARSYWLRQLPWGRTDLYYSYFCRQVRLQDLHPGLQLRVPGEPDDPGDAVSAADELRPAVRGRLLHAGHHPRLPVLRVSARRLHPRLHRRRGQPPQTAGNEIRCTE